MPFTPTIVPTLRARTALRLVHYWWPLVVGWSLTLVVQRATLRAWHPGGVAVLLLGIVAAYSLDRIVDPPAGGLGRSLRQLLATTALGAAAIAAFVLPTLPPPTAALVPLIGAGVILYPAIKRFPVTKTFFVPLVWTWCAIALPFSDGSWFGWRWVQQPIALPLLLVLTANVLLCDLKDEPHDRRHGVATLPVVLGPRAATWIAVALAVAGGVVAQVEQRHGLACGALGLGVSTLWPRLLATDVVGPLLVDAALTLPGLLIAARIV